MNDSHEGIGEQIFDSADAFALEACQVKAWRALKVYKNQGERSLEQEQCYKIDYIRAAEI